MYASLALATAAAAVVLLPGAAIADPEQSLATTCWGTDGGSPPTHGQSFTADETGQITAIAMHLQITQPPAGSLILSIHSGNGFAGTQLLSQHVSSPHESGFITPIVVYPLDSPLPVTMGQVYTIGIMVTDGGTDSGGFCGTLANVYAGGSSYFNSSAFEGADAAFKVTIEPATSVPALSERALILLGFSLLSLMGWVIRQQRNAFRHM